jgi:hypothetical protein
MIVIWIFISYQQYAGDTLLYVIPGVVIIPDLYYLAIMTLVPLTLTAYQVCRTPKNKVGEVEKSMNNREIRALFKKYCESEFSSENFLAYDEVQTYKEQPTLELAHHILATYLQPYAPIEVNVQRKTVIAVVEILAKGELPPDLFETIARDLIANMSDTFCRFVLTDDYKIQKQKKELIEKI